MITISTTVNADRQKVWNLFTAPEHVTRWSQASADWHTPSMESDLKPGGKFKTRMEARDGSMGFDFAGTYDEVNEPESYSYSLEDGRRVEVQFEEKDGATKVTESFDPEAVNPVDMQRQGWQSILDSFKRYAEGQQ